MPIGKKFYFLAFDLNIDNLKMYYPNKNINQAWDDIKRFMTKNGFEHNQYSAYISKDRITQYKIRSVMRSMYKKLPWFPLCANKVMLSELNSQEKLLTSITKIKAIKILIDKLKANPPGKNRGLSSAQPPAAPSGKQRQPPAPPVPPVQQNPDTVTVSISELKELFEAGADFEVTVKKSDLEQAKKQAEAKKQSSTKSGDSEKSEEPPTQSKPKPTHKPKR